MTKETQMRGRSKILPTRAVAFTLALTFAQMQAAPFLWAAGDQPADMSTGLSPGLNSDMGLQPAIEPPMPTQPRPAQMIPPSEEMLQETPIPQTPSAPPQLFERTPPDTFRCQRFFVYEGKTVGCDSNLKADGDRLRPILRSVPAAIAQLDQYQRSQRVLRTTAYTGSSGLLFLLAGLFAGQGGGKNALFLGGAALFFGSLGYGLISLRTNEAKLGDAVETYNHARPEDPVELQFKTRIGF
jgi:hypothetical protein